ncbi:MAG: sll1863 family stress response protein [Pirellulaceae bacterium]
MVRLSLMLMLAGLLTTSGCEQKPADQLPGKATPGKVTPEDVRRDAGKAVDTTAEYSQQAKEEFQKKLDARLKELDAEIVKLRAKGADLKDDAKTKWDQKMAELEAKRDAARVKLTEVGQSSGEAWKDVQKGAQSAWDELDKSFRDASQEF